MSFNGRLSSPDSRKVSYGGDCDNSSQLMAIYAYMDAFAITNKSSRAYMTTIPRGRVQNHNVVGGLEGSLVIFPR